uniref:Macrophage-expressed gene 1 protein n=1 Tax=Panagrolaimus davidi TaxID=227884 RepID=A0A914PP25_9BILA
MCLISYILGFTTLFLLSVADVSVLSPEDKCIANIRKEIKDRKVSRNLGGIVGIGWDSLKDKATLPVFSQTYHLCRTVPDGDFLVPDNIHVLPIKEANIQKSSETFDTFSHYKSSTGGSFKASGGGGIPGIGSAEASFGVSTKVGKEHMEKNKRTGFSNKIEYHAFTLIGSEKAGFDEIFTMRLNDIAKAIKDKNRLLAQYEAESIIADYGTHVVNKALAGASVTMLGFSETTSVEDKKSFSMKMSADFHASFLGAVSTGVSASADTETSSDSGSDSTKSQTYIMTKGGPDVNRLLSSNAENKMQIDSVVGLNHEGMPIYSFIHTGVLKGKEWDDTTIFVVQDLIYNATQEYIRRNQIPGCTISASVRYFHKANVDFIDACGYTFYSEESYMGGYYQECEYIESYSKKHRNHKNGNQCGEYRHVNPLTRDFSCPERGSIDYSISFFISFHDRVYNDMPDGCNTTDCSKNFTITDRINVTIYICSPGYPEGKDDLFMIFGGIFDTKNVFSDNGRCSLGFDEYPIFHNQKICLSLGYNNAITEFKIKKGFPDVLAKGVSLRGFKSCIIDNCHGTPYYLTTINNCPYYYCVMIPDGNFNDTLAPLIDSPPYVSRDMAMSKMRLSYQHEIDEFEDIDEDDKTETMIFTKDGKKVRKIFN